MEDKDKSKKITPQKTPTMKDLGVSSNPTATVPTGSVPTTRPISSSGVSAKAVGKKVEEQAKMEPDVDEILRKCVQQIWTEYDDDASGFLDKDECKNFIMDTVKEMGDGEQFTDEDFEACFAQVDTDGSGTIDQDEMLSFIKIVANIN